MLEKSNIEETVKISKYRKMLDEAKKIMSEGNDSLRIVLPSIAQAEAYKRGLTRYLEDEDHLSIFQRGKIVHLIKKA